MTGGRKGKRKQNATKWTQKKRSSSSASGVLTKNASEVNSPIPEKKLLLEKTLHEERSAHQENEKSQLQVENNLGSESQKYVPPFSRRENVALVSGVVKSQKDFANKDKTTSPRTLKTNMSLPHQKSKTKPKTKKNKLEVGECCMKSEFSTVNEDLLLTGQKNRMSASNTELVVTEWLNEIVQTAGEICSLVAREADKSLVRKEKNLSSEATLVSIKPQMETKDTTKRNTNLKRKTKAIEEVKLSENVVRDEKEEHIKMEFADEEYSPKRHKHYKGEIAGLENPVQTSTTLDTICLNQSTTDAVSHEGLDFEVKDNNTDYNKVTGDSNSIKKVKDWLESQKSQAICKQEISCESCNYTGSTGVKETSTSGGKNKQELNLSSKDKQIKSSAKKSQTEGNTTNVNFVLQLSVDKNSRAKVEENSNKILVSEELRPSQSISNDLKTLGNNKCCKALENNELQSVSNIVVASLCHTDEEFVVKAISLAGNSDSCKEKLSNESYKKSSRTSQNEQVISYRPGSPPPESICFPNLESTPGIESSAICTDITNSDLTHTNQQLESIKQSVHENHDPQPHFNVVKSFCVMHDTKTSNREHNLTKNEDNSSQQTSKCSKEQCNSINFLNQGPEVKQHLKTDSTSLDNDISLSQCKANKKIIIKNNELKRHVYPNFHVNNSEAAKVEAVVTDTRNQNQDLKTGVKESEAVTAVVIDQEIKNSLEAAKASNRDPVCCTTAGDNHHTTNAPNDAACNQNQSENICAAEKIPGNVDDSNNMVNSDTLVGVDNLPCNLGSFLNSSSKENGSCTKGAVNVGADNSETTLCVTDKNTGLNDACAINTHSGNELVLTRVNSVPNGSKPFPNAYCCSMANEKIESVARSRASDDCNELEDHKTQENVREAKIPCEADRSNENNIACSKLNQVANFVNASRGDKNHGDARYKVDSVTIMNSGCTTSSRGNLDSSDKCNEVDSVVVSKLRNNRDHDESLDSADKHNGIDSVEIMNSDFETDNDAKINQANETSGVDSTAAVKLSLVTSSSNGSLNLNENSDVVESIATMESSSKANDRNLNLFDKSDGADDIANIMKTSFLADGIGKLDSAGCKTYSNIVTSVHAADKEAALEPLNETNMSSGGESKEFGISVEDLLKSEDFSDSQLIQTAASCTVTDLRSLSNPVIPMTTNEPTDCQMITEGYEMVNGLIKELSALNEVKDVNEPLWMSITHLNLPSMHNAINVTDWLCKYVMQARREVDLLKKQHQVRMKALKTKRK